LSDSFGPIEVLSSVFDAIQTAVAQGFVVVEAAGNGGVNLDDAACSGVFDRSVRDSGAIIVGAGHQPSSGVDRQREEFSSFGSRVDLQGWGSYVVTTGYGDLYLASDRPADPGFWYTGVFSGTSSAAAIVAGAVANLQGIALAQSGVPVAPLEIRTLLVQTGSPQLGNTDEPIGPRPNLRQAIAQLTHGAIHVALDIQPGHVSQPHQLEKH
jgi:subtilisin family serine protease